MDLKWLKTWVLALLGGGAAAAFQALTDPSKYQFPQDFGSGKLWKYVFMGWGLTFAALLVKSPLGRKVVDACKGSQEQLAADKEVLEKAKADLKPVSESKQVVTPQEHKP